MSRHDNPKDQTCLKTFKTLTLTVSGSAKYHTKNM